ncbi:hypothetical protein PLANPX_3573 [Lacipirellula parvula]|uniref:Uncharacterized protein n=1 Tax=Lacipirellula parvula TaxID=2650471 RepID=A0A5K7XGC9_9BACT|nr:hypothetical protein PLANPX_3573 [Lacipirellula parvula]
MRRWSPNGRADRFASGCLSFFSWSRASARHLSNAATNHRSRVENLADGDSPPSVAACLKSSGVTRPYCELPSFATLLIY